MSVLVVQELLSGLKIFLLSAQFRLFKILRTDFVNRPEPLSFVFMKKLGGGCGIQMLLVIRSLFSLNLILSSLWNTLFKPENKHPLDAQPTSYYIQAACNQFIIFMVLLSALLATVFRKQSSARPPPYELLYSNKHLSTPYSSLHTHSIMLCFYAF